MQEKNSGIITVGATTKFGNFIFKYPAISASMLIVALEVFAFVAGSDNAKLWRVLWCMACVCLPVVILIYFLGNKWCYKIEIDKSKNSITFYRLCNRGVDIFSIGGIRIVIGAYCHILIDDSDFILHYFYMHDLVAHLPKDTQIEYRGLSGKRAKERYWDKYNIPLIPGSANKDERNGDTC